MLHPDPIRVVMLAAYPEDERRIGGGVEAVVRVLANEMGKRPEIDLHVVSSSPANEESSVELPGGVSLHRVPRRRLARLSSYHFEKSLLMQLLGRLQPHIVHAHGTGLYAGVAVDSTWPHVVTVHGINRREGDWAFNVSDRIRWWFEARFESHVMRQVRCVISISPYVETEFQERTQANFHLIENPVSEIFWSNTEEGELGRILVAGRLIPRKDPATALRAFSKLLRTFPDARLRFAGETATYPQYVEDIRQLASDLGVVNRVSFLGELEEPELVREFSRCHLLLLTSRQETAPVVISQALARGKPVVSTLVGGTGSLVKNGKTGFLVPAGDSEGLCAAIQKIFESPQLSGEMSVAARCDAEARFAPATVVDRTLEVYRSLLNRD